MLVRREHGLLAVSGEFMGNRANCNACYTDVQYTFYVQRQNCAVLLCCTISRNFSPPLLSFSLQVDVSSCSLSREQDLGIQFH